MQPAPIKEILMDEKKHASPMWIRWFQLVQNILGGAAISTVRIAFADSPYTITDVGINLVCNTSGGAIVVNYPPGEQGILIRVVNAGSSGNSVTVNGNGSEEIKGAASQVITDGQVLEARFDSVEGWF